MSNQFVVGDRVECVKSTRSATRNHVGKIGTVKHIRNGRTSIGVEFDEAITNGIGGWYGHNLNDSIASAKGWYVHSEELRLLPPEVPCPIDDLL